MKSRKRNPVLPLLLALCLLLAPCRASAVPADPDEYVTMEYRGGHVSMEVSTGRIVGVTGFSGRVELPESVGGVPARILGVGSVRDNGVITELVLPHGMTEVEEGAVSSNEQLQVLRLSDTVERLDPEAANWLYEIVRILVPEGNPYLRNGKSGEITSKDGRRLILVPKDLETVEVEPQVREIGDRAMGWCAMREVILPEGLEKIGEGAFYACGVLEEVRLPASLVSIGEGAFTSCSCQVIPAQGSGAFVSGGQGELYGDGGETLLYCPPGVQSLAVRPGTRRVGVSAAGGGALKKLALPEGVAEIGDYAFWCCPIQSLSLPSTLRSVGTSAFEACDLQSVVLPEGLRSLGVFAFAGMPALESAVLPASLEEIDPMAVDYNVTLCYVQEGTPAWRWAVENEARIRLGAPEEYAPDFPQPEPGTPFVDLDGVQTMAEIKELYSAGLFHGVSRDLFGPDEEVTRGMFAALLYRAHGSPAVSRETIFSDVPEGACYAGAVEWAWENGLMQGTGERTFSPQSAVTREQAVTVLHRYSQMLGYRDEVGESGRIKLKELRDADKVSGWAGDAVAWALDAGILLGSGGRVQPGAPVTRELAAWILCRGLNFLRA